MGYLLESNCDFRVSEIEHRVKNGVTLVEMLIALAIIALLATMVIGIASRINNQAKEKALEGTFALLECALDEYKDFTDYFPVPEANNVDPNENSEFLYEQLNLIPSSKKILERINDKLIQNKYKPTVVPHKYEIYDLWGTVLDYIYDPNFNSYPQLISAGPDRKFDTSDDITNR